MGLVGEISDALRSVGSAVRKGPELISSLGGLSPNNKSIMRGAKDSTFQFQCLISDTVSTDLATTTSRLLDRKYAEFTQSWLSLNSMFDITIDPTPISYLKKFHTNINFESVEERECASMMEGIYDGSYRLFMNEERTYGLLFNEARISEEAKTANYEYLKEYMSDFDLTPIEPSEFFEDSAGRNSAFDTTTALLQAQAERNNVQSQKDRADLSKNSLAPKLLERDVKKTNDLTPYGIQVRLIAVNDKKEFVQYVDIIIGVKTILNLIPAHEMVTNLGRALQNKSLAFKFLRWTTGEISLLKDIVLNLNDIKMDTVDKYNKNNPYFHTLKKLKNKKIGVRNLTVPNKILPTATIVVSRVDIDYLVDNFAIDLRKPLLVKKLMDNLLLMSFIIIDDGTGTVNIFDDGDSVYQTYSIDVIERDATLMQNKYGKQIGLMNAGR
jgi:hypothetical protein